MYIQVCIQGGCNLLLKIPSEGEVNSRPVLFIISCCKFLSHVCSISTGHEGKVLKLEWNREWNWK